MSYQATAWAVQQSAGSSVAKVVLLVLAEAANPEGETFLGHAEIARRAELGRRAVVNQMRRLVSAGLIERVRRTDARGHRTSDLMRLSLDAPRALRTEAQSAPDAPTGVPVLSAHDDMSKVHATTRLGAPGAQDIVREPVNEPVRARQSARRKPESTIPKDFPAVKDMTFAAATAKSAGVTLDVGREAYRFRNHAEQNDRRCRDWSAAWRNWVDKSIEQAPKSRAPLATAPASDDWPGRLSGFRANGYWNVGDWGPRPGKPGCRAPAPLLTEFGYERAEAA
jgi:hypothetical protein